MENNEFKCELCHNIYIKGWTDEEANDELEKNFSIDPEECGTVCDDCYNEIMNPLKIIK